MPGAGTLLLPNLGTEEGDDWRSFAAHPAVATTARLWRLLFAAPTSWLGYESSEPDDEGWPSALGPRPDRAVFPWLEQAGPLTPWLASGEAAELCRGRGGTLAGPAPSVVWRVHDKAFAQRQASDLGHQPRCLAELIHVFEPQELAAPDTFVTRLTDRLSRWPAWTGGRFSLKPRLGSSGRGRLAGDARRPDTPALRGALPRLAARGGALLEPWLDRRLDLSVLLHVRASVPEPGATAASPVTLLGSLEQILTPSGLYRGHLGELDSRGRVFSGSSHDEAIREAAAALAGAARAAGFSGPCGVDSFAFRLRDGADERDVLRPVVEFNARFTAGIVAIGLMRRALDRVRGPLGLEPGERRAFLFSLDTPAGWSSWQSGARQLGEATRLVPLWRDRDSARPALLFAQRLDRLREELGIG